MGAKFHDRGEGDLFDDFHPAEKKIRKKTGLSLPRLKKSLTVSYENIIFIVIAFLMGCIIAFTLGVEKGKNMRRTVSSAIIKTAETERPRDKTAEASRDTSKITPDRDEAGYVVQLAAFKKIGPANQEHKKLEKLGYKPRIKKSGPYFQVFVGYFDDKNEAQRVRNELKKDYNDCYVKKTGTGSL